jgi:hypothetical protein
MCRDPLPIGMVRRRMGRGRFRHRVVRPTPFAIDIDGV